MKLYVLHQYHCRPPWILWICGKKNFLSSCPLFEGFVSRLTNQSLGFGSTFTNEKSGVCKGQTLCRSPQLPAMLTTHIPMQIMQYGQVSSVTIPVIMQSMQSDDKSKPSKYARYGTDMESFRDASQALPYVYKFFWMIYRLSPVRTIIIIAVFLIQGFLPALRLRTGGDFIRQVACHVYQIVLTVSCKREYSQGR
jgi:hypothetical protein